MRVGVAVSAFVLRLLHRGLARDLQSKTHSSSTFPERINDLSTVIYHAPAFFFEMKVKNKESKEIKKL
jgi:hypothetical protein